MAQHDYQYGDKLVLVDVGELVEAAAALRRMENRGLPTATAALDAVHHLHRWRARVAASRQLLSPPGRCVTT